MRKRVPPAAVLGAFAPGAAPAQAYPPEEFAKHIRAELARWAKVIKAAKIELE